MAIQSNLHATPHCSLPSGPHLGPLPEPSPYPTYHSSLLTVGPLVASVAPGSVPGSRVLSTAQRSLLMTATSHCGFSSMTESLSYKSTFNESIMEMYTVFLHAAIPQKQYHYLLCPHCCRRSSHFSATVMVIAQGNVKQHKSRSNNSGLRKGGFCNYLLETCCLSITCVGLVPI